MVGVVSGRDARRTRTRCCSAQCLEPMRPSSCLEVAARLDPGDRPVERHAELLREGLGLVELPLRVRAQPVIDAVGDELVPQRAPEARQHVQECHGVGAAADRHEHACRSSCRAGLSAPERLGRART